MSSKLILATFVLIASKATNAKKSTYSATWTFERVDDLLLRAMPLGDAKVKFPEKASEYGKICDEIKGMVVAPSLYVLFASTALKIKEFRESFFPMFKDKLKNKLCDLAKRNETAYTKFAKEVNNDWPYLIPVREKFTNAFVMAEKPKQTDIKGSDLGCLFKKYLDVSLNQIKGLAAIDVMRSMLNGYSKVIEKLNPSKFCDWQEFPEAGQHKFRSIDILLFFAGKNVLISQQVPKSSVASSGQIEAPVEKDATKMEA